MTREASATDVTRAGSFVLYPPRYAGDRPWPEFPMPTDEGRDISVARGWFTVVASVVYDEEYTRATVLLLYREPPFFGVGIVNTLTGEFDDLERHMNIVPAVRQYEQSGGDY